MTFLLAELEELLELTQPQEFLNICVPLFRCISRCLMSPHFQVAERALFLWNNEYIVQQITNFKKTIFRSFSSRLRRTLRANGTRQSTG